MLTLTVSCAGHENHDGVVVTGHGEYVTLGRRTSSRCADHDDVTADGTGYSRA
jgi:hypothetical protein